MKELNVYAVVSTYYKYGEYKLEICYGDNSLRRYLLDYYNRGLDITDSNDIDEIIEEAIRKGEDIIERQAGWGIREVRKI